MCKYLVFASGDIVLSSKSEPECYFAALLGELEAAFVVLPVLV